MNMGSIPHELIPKTISDFLNHVSAMPNASEKCLKLNGYIISLEDELRKIDAFQKELSVSRLIVKDAIDYLKEMGISFTITNAEPVLAEFIPLKKDELKEKEIEVHKKDDDDKENWSSSLQLGSSYSQTENANFISKLNKKSTESSTSLLKKRDKEILPVSTLSLVPQAMKKLKNEPSSKNINTICNRFGSSPVFKVGPSNLRTVTLNPPQNSRKQRRCWSPELHKLFVDAIRQLGGSQATPKQIRELMGVDGLTNDEVKSHLQKYRLHSKRNSSEPKDSSKNQSVFLGKLWSPKDQHCESSKHSDPQSCSPQGPFELADKNSMEEDDYDDEGDESDSHNGRNRRIHNLVNKLA